MEDRMVRQQQMVHQVVRLPVAHQEELTRRRNPLQPIHRPPTIDPEPPQPAIALVPVRTVLPLVKRVTAPPFQHSLRHRVEV